jgi:hypothetical protein
MIGWNRPVPDGNSEKKLDQLNNGWQLAASFAPNVIKTRSRNILEVFFGDP